MKLQAIMLIGLVVLLVGCAHDISSPTEEDAGTTEQPEAEEGLSFEAEEEDIDFGDVY